MSDVVGGRRRGGKAGIRDGIGVSTARWYSVLAALARRGPSEALVAAVEAVPALQVCPPVVVPASLLSVTVSPSVFRSAGGAGIRAGGVMSHRPGFSSRDSDVDGACSSGCCRLPGVRASGGLSSPALPSKPHLEVVR